jgi:hypothetical protein
LHLSIRKKPQRITCRDAEVQPAPYPGLCGSIVSQQKINASEVTGRREQCFCWFEMVRMRYLRCGRGIKELSTSGKKTFAIQTGK